MFFLKNTYFILFFSLELKIDKFIFYVLQLKVSQIAFSLAGEPKSYKNCAFFLSPTEKQKLKKIWPENMIFFGSPA